MSKEYRLAMGAWGIAILLIGLVLFWADSRTKEITDVGDCVSRMVEVSGFEGTPGEAWNMFANDCSNGK